MHDEVVRAPARFIDTEPTHQIGRGKPIYRAISFKDVERLLQARNSQDLIEFAVYHEFSLPRSLDERMKFKSPNEKSPKPLSEEEAIADRQLLINAYRCMRKFMDLACSLRQDYLDDGLTVSTLRKRGITVEQPTEDEIRRARFAEGNIQIAHNMGLEGFLEPIIQSMKADAIALRNPSFHLELQVEDDSNPYVQFLKQGVVRAMAYDGDMRFENRNGAVSIDLINKHFPMNREGYRDAVKTALDTLFRINLSDAITVTSAGIMQQECMSVFSSLWFELSKSFESGRVARCRACGTPMVIRGERGKKRLYCSGACSKWAQRHPGQTRGQDE